MNVFLWNARPRNTHVEATLNHPFPAQVIDAKGHAVVVVAEGAGEELLGESAEVDAGGNKKLPAIGEWLVSKIKHHFKASGKEATLKYIDPSYMVRSTAADAGDSYLCMLLAHASAHGAMAGYTGFTVGLVNNRTVMIPIPELARTSPRSMNATGRTWERVLSITNQPGVYVRRTRTKGDDAAGAP